MVEYISLLLRNSHKTAPLCLPAGQGFCHARIEALRGPEAWFTSGKGDAFIIALECLQSIWEDISFI